METLMMPDNTGNRAAHAQGTAAHLAQLLPRLAGESPEDMNPIGISEHQQILLDPEHAWLLYVAALRSLPHCFAIADGFPVDPSCKMPDGICHRCAAEGRCLPPDHPLR